MSEQIISPGVFANENDQSLVTQGTKVAGLAIVGPTVGGTPLVPTVVTSYSDYLSKFGDIFQSGSYYYEYLTSLAVKEYFNAGGQTVLVTKIISGSGYSTFSNAYVNKLGTSVSVAASASFQIETLKWGNQMNNTGSATAGVLSSGSASNVRWEVSNVDTSSGLFTLLVRSGNDSPTSKNILETWANMSLDPQQSNYISRVIGDQRELYDATNSIISINGNYPVNSQYIRVVPNSVAATPNSLDNLGNYLSASYSASLPAVGSGSYNGSFAGGIAATNRTGSFFEAITSTAAECQGFAATDYSAALTLLANKDEFDFNLLLVPGATLGTGPLSSISDDTIALAEGRTDSMAIIDATAYGQTPAAAVTAAAASTSNYAATYYPWVQVYSSNLGKAVWVPPSVVMGGVYAFNDQVAAEWFAPAGLNRGGIGSVIRAERKLAQSDRDTLYTGNVNPLATFPGNGVVAFGQKTLQKRPTALDRVSVRRLLITIKRFLSQTARGLLFEQNTQTTRNKFLSVAEPYLESIVQRQGLYVYKVVMDDTNNTPDVIDRNQLVGQIFIQPTKTAEFIILNFTITPTGATFA
jgi:hypothetical protein